MFSIRLHLFVMCHKFVINMYRVIALLFVFLHGTLIEKHKNVLIFFSYMWISPHGLDCKRAVRQNKRTGSLEKVQNCTMYTICKPNRVFTFLTNVNYIWLDHLYSSTCTVNSLTQTFLQFLLTVFRKSSPGVLKQIP